MQQAQFKNRIITDTGTTVVTADTCAVSSIVIAVNAAGTTWTLQITDGGSPAFTIVPKFTLVAPTELKPVIITFTDPVRMDGGIKILTTGTHGEACVWTTAWA